MHVVGDGRLIGYRYVGLCLNIKPKLTRFWPRRRRRATRICVSPRNFTTDSQHPMAHFELKLRWRHRFFFWRLYLKPTTQFAYQIRLWRYISFVFTSLNFSPPECHPLVMSTNVTLLPKPSLHSKKLRNPVNEDSALKHNSAMLVRLSVFGCS